MKQRSALVLVLAATMLAAGCSSYRPAPAAFHEALTEPYIIDAGDRLRVTVFEQDGLTNSYAVNQSGYLAFPLIGQVAARGYTVQQVERYRPVYVMGEVGAAGQYAYTPGMTAQKAIATAGGYTPRANQASVDITRDINGNVMTGRVATSDPVLPGDTIYVRERLF
jgi:polysaccharide biosynthesis/export protein